MECGDQMSEVTCEPAARDEVRAPVVVDQKWMCWSWLPPPVARRLVCQGHHARACVTVSCCYPIFRDDLP